MLVLLRSDFPASHHFNTSYGLLESLGQSSKNMSFVNVFKYIDIRSEEPMDFEIRGERYLSILGNRHKWLRDDAEF